MAKDTPKSTQDAEGSNIAQAHGAGAIANVITNIFRGETAEQRAQQNRQAMLQLVRNTWVKGVLEQSLHGAAMLELGMEYRPEAVERPWDMVLQTPDSPDETLPHGTRIHQVFDRIGGALLILGAPGSGKTTTLLELARDAIARAEADPTLPIPVVFNLSTWSDVRRGRRGREQKQTFGDWLVGTLNSQYHVARKTARAWVENDALLLLLDGLDEVPTARRDSCVAAINGFRQEHGFVPLVVCSRSADYAALAGKLQLQSAVVLQPLTRAQIDVYLDGAGVELDAVRATLDRDPILQEMAQSPLMLSIMTLAYRGADMSASRHLRTARARREHMLQAYVQKMFTRRSKVQPYTPEQTVRGLAWLAQQMTAHGQTVFLLENVQPDWLPEADARWARRIAWGGGILFLGLAGMLLGGLFGRLLEGLIGGILGGLLGGPGVMVTATEKLVWSWRKAARGLIVGLIGGLIAGLVLGFVWGSSVSSDAALQLGSIFGSVFGIGGGIVLGLTAGLQRAEVTVRTEPNQGIQQTAKYAVTLGVGIAIGIGLLVKLGFWLAVELSDVWDIMRGEGLVAGLILGLGIRLAFGGRAVLLHYALRGALWRAGYLPRTWIRFFDHAASRILLRQIGGGYIFIHQLLQEYFAAVSFQPPRKLSLPQLGMLPRHQKTRLFLRFALILILLSISTPIIGRQLVADAREFAGLAYTFLGMIYYRYDNSEAALVAFTYAIRFNPENGLAYHNRGVIYRQIGQYEQAIADYDRAIKLDPQYASTYNNRGGAYADLGQYEYAIADYDRAIELDPQYASAYHNRGYAYANLGQYERAIEDYTQSLILNPQPDVTYLTRGQAYQALGHTQEARADFEYLLEASDDPSLRAAAESALHELDATPTPGDDTP